MISAEQQAELERPVVRVVYFVEFDFASGVQRLCSANITLAWGGYDWGGAGSLGSISAVEETGGLAPRALKFELNGAAPSWLAAAVGPVEEYRGRAAKLYMCPLDEQFRLVGTPERCWTGRMQTVAISHEGKEGNIVLNCETSAFNLKRAAGLRLNSARHEQNHPGDLGLRYLEDLQAKPETWLSKRFQER